MRAITDSTGAIVKTFQTDEFGITLLTQGTSPEPFRFTGQEWDAESGFYNLRASFYAPALGRFVSRDRVFGSPASPLSLNRTSYAGNNPVNVVDPSGRCWWEDFCINESEDAYYAVLALLAWAATEVASHSVVLRDSNSTPTFGNATYASSNRVIADRIAHGHAWDDHRGEFPDVKSEEDLAGVIEDVMDHGRWKDRARDGATAYWDRRRGILVIVEPSNPDGGTVYVPDRGSKDFERFGREGD